MEAEWVADRTALRVLLREHPDWRQSDFAEALNRSLAWVKKWIKRFRDTTPDDVRVLHSRSRAHKTPSPSVAPEIVERILAIRDTPPYGLGRIPGPKAILYYLQLDETIPVTLPRPRSTRTIWRILHAHQRILAPGSRQHTPTEPVEPMTSWQLDFKDATTVTPLPDGKKQHTVEVLNTIDVGTSILVDAQARTDFTAETALVAVAQLLEANGLPESISIDRDPRWVGSQQGRDFPAPLIRFLLCLGVQVTVCPARRPDKNGYVERYHRTYNQECLQVYRPADLEQVQVVTAQFRQHYNHERPHQGRACANQPPMSAFPQLPLRPRVPVLVDPDRWLHAVDGVRLIRRLGRDGIVRVDSQFYYVTTRLAGQKVSVRIDAKSKALVIEHNGQVVKERQIRGIGSGELPYAAYVERMRLEARSDIARQMMTRTQLRLPLE